MNKAILIALLIIISKSGTLYAQNRRLTELDLRLRQSKTEKTFAKPANYFNIRDYVYLKDAQIITELTNVADYSAIANLDSILKNFKKDIAFYKDSLETNEAGNVRIDYALEPDPGLRKIRFRKYKADGDIFVKQGQETAKLKLEQDTVRIIMHLKDNTGKYLTKKTAYLSDRYMQVTICLNNYTGIDDVIAEQELYRHAVDTIVAGKTGATVQRPWKFPSSSIYRPYTPGVPALTKFNGILDNSYSTRSPFTRSDKLTLNVNMGVSLVRNTLAPMAEIGIAVYNAERATYTRGYQDEEYNTFVQLCASPYFFFDRNASGDFSVKDNWFVNFEMGGAARLGAMSTPLLTGGVGYLAVSKGDYFKGTTMKAFLNIKFRNGITLSPEVIFTNNFKQAFPGITMKIF